MPSRKEELVARAKKLIGENLKKGITIEGVSEALGISRSQFSAVFSEVTGTSPGAYLLSTKIETAARMIRDTGMGISEIAREVGYRDHSMFTLAFRKATGIPPQTYRERQASADAVKRLPFRVALLVRKHYREITVTLIATAVLIVAFSAGYRAWAIARQAGPKPEWDLVFSDDFNRSEPGPDWRPGNGVWKISDGRLVTDSDSELWFRCARIFPGNIRVTFDGWVRKDAEARDIMLSTHGSRTRRERYRFSLGESSNTRSAILKDMGPLAFSSMTLKPGHRYAVEVIVLNGVLTFSVNGSVLLEVTDPFPLSGPQYGILEFYSFGRGKEFDDLRVYTQKPAAWVDAMQFADDPYREGRYDEARRQYRKFDGATPEMSERARYRQALCFFLEKQHDHALELLGKISSGPLDEAARALELEIYLKRAEYARATEQRKRMRTRYGKHETLAPLSSAYAKTVAELVDAHKLPEAVELEKEMLEIVRGDRYRELAAMINVGNLYVRQGNFDLSRKYYEQAFHLRRGTGEQWCYAGTQIVSVHILAGQYELAIEKAERFLEVSGMSGESLGRLYNGINQAAMFAGDFEKARAYAEKLREEMPGLPSLYLSAAGNALAARCAMGEVKEAIEEAETLLAENTMNRFQAVRLAKRIELARMLLGGSEADSRDRIGRILSEYSDISANEHSHFLTIHKAALLGEPSGRKLLEGFEMGDPPGPMGRLVTSLLDGGRSDPLEDMEFLVLWESAGVIHFLTAEYHRVRGDRAKARKHYQKCIETAPYPFLIHQLSKKRIGQNT